MTIQTTRRFSLRHYISWRLAEKQWMVGSV
jgi:hypothetical protein